MKFLIDNAVSPLVAEGLVQGGYDAVHIRDYGLQSASDDDVFDRSVSEERVLVTADTDFGFLLARRKQTKPSVLLFHYSFTHRPEEQVRILLQNLTMLSKPIEEGSVIVFEASRIRIRPLPIIP